MKCFLTISLQGKGLFYKSTSIRTPFLAPAALSFANLAFPTFIINLPCPPHLPRALLGVFLTYFHLGFLVNLITEQPGLRKVEVRMAGPLENGLRGQVVAPQLTFEWPVKVMYHPFP